MVDGGWAKVALVVALAACSACVRGGQGPGIEEQAREQFARAAFCPEPRVEVRRFMPIPAPPPVIARDPGRLAMWNGIHEQAAAQDPRQLVAVTGCDERATYACWEFAGWAEGSRHRERVSIGWSCIRLEPAGQDLSRRSTTEEEQPKTTASSR